MNSSSPASITILRTAKSRKRDSLGLYPASTMMHDERGAIMVIAVFFAIFLSALLFAVVGTAQAVFFREHLQDQIDGAAMSGAIVNAQAMNLVVLANIVASILLAILVALKLIEGLCYLIIAILVGLAFLTAGATLAGVPPVEAVRATVTTIHDTLKGPIFSALSALNKVSTTVKKVTPELARLGAHGRLTTSEDLGETENLEGLVWGSAVELPIEDDKYKVLCGEAGERVADLALYQFEHVGIKFNNQLRQVKKAANSIAKELAFWFCDDTSSVNFRAIPHDVKGVIPKTSFLETCQTKRLIPGAEREEACRKQDASTPDDETGLCRFGSAEECKPYEERVALARKQCVPDSTLQPERYSYLVHHTSVTYTFNGKNWVRGTPLDGIYRYEKEVDRAPCGPKDKNPSVGVGVQTKVHPNDEPSVVLPVCSNEQPPKEPALGGDASALPPIGEERKVSFTEVTHLLGCTRTEREKIKIAKGNNESTDKKTSKLTESEGDVGSASDENRESDEGENKSPKRVKKKTNLGDEVFQIRAISKRPFVQNAVDKLVATARFNDSRDGSNPLQGLAPLGDYSYAQAEYFYDGEGRENWMWNMNWKARLKRFVLPKKSKDKSWFSGECVAWVDSSCATLLEELFGAKDLSTH